MPQTLPPIAILGAGSMGGAIATGLSRSGLAPRVTVTNRTAAKASSLAGFDGVTTLALADDPGANAAEPGAMLPRWGTPGTGNRQR